MRPSRVNALRTRHALLAVASPVPPVLAATPDGLAVLPALPGDGGVITGLLDVDTAGPGHRIDEWATLLAHLSVLRPGARTALRSRPARAR